MATILIDEDYSDDTPNTVYASNDFDIDGIRYVLTGTGGVTYQNTIGDGGITGSTVDNSLLFDFSNASPDGAGGLSSITISAADGSAFSLAGISFLIYNLEIHGQSSDVTLSTSRGSLPSFSPNGSTGSIHHLDLSANTAFQNITSFTFSGTHLTIEIDNLNFEPIPAVAPSLVATALNPTFTENGSAVDLFDGVTAATNDASQSFTGATFTVTNVSNGAAESLTIGGTSVSLVQGNAGTLTGIGNFSVSVTGGVATVTVSGMTRTETQMNDLIDAITYINTSDNPGNASRVVTITQITDDGSNNNTTAPNITSTVSVAPVNDAPVTTVPANIAVTEDAASALTGISFADADASSSAVTVTLSVGSGSLAATSGGAVVVGGTASAMTLTGSIANINTFIAGSNVTFTTAANATSNVTLNVGINDGGNTGSGGAQTDSETVTLVVTAVNDAPTVAAPGSIAFNEDTTGAVTGISFADLDAGSSSVTVTLSVPGGTMAATGGGGVTVGGTASALTLTGSVANINTFIAGSNVTYTPAANASGNVTLSVGINDGGNTGSGGAQIASTTVTLAVAGDNDAPVAVADSITVAEGGTATVLSGGATSLLTNDTDPENDPLAAVLVTGPVNGSLVLNSNGTFQYVHNGSETTTDSFTYKPNDGTVDGNIVTVSISVTPVNDPPVAVADSLTVVQGAAAQVLIGGATSVLANDTDPEGNSLTAVLVTGPANGTLTLNADGTFTYTHNNSATTNDSFTYRANDGLAISNLVTVTVSVTPANATPTVANPIPNQNATEDAAFNFQLAANTFADTDGDTLTYTAQIAGGGTLPAWLSFDPATCTFSGTPVNASVGTLSVDVTASDGKGGTITDTFNLVVANTNDDPTVFNSVPNQSATEDAAFNFQFDIGTFTDEDVGDTLTYSAQLAGGGALPAWLNFDAATRTFTGTPGNAHVGTLSVTLIASDGHGGGTATDTFDIVVANTNDAPTVANPIANRTGTEGVAFNFQFAASAFADVDVGDILTYSAQLAGGGALPAWLSFNPATRTFSGTPTGTGTVSIEVTADDGHGGTVADSFDVVIGTAPVDPEPEPPVTPPVT
ncbi:MAG: tandem-95 repeat protein, partial [Acidovorax sp.]